MRSSKSSKLKKPNFLCIGVPRCGTNWLYENLRLHPEIFLAESKEIHFFNREDYYKKGPEWYFNYFKNSDKKVVGEMTPNYTASYVPQRIKEVLGNPKIILMVRNPIDRIYSMYKLLVWKLALRQNFNCYSECTLSKHLLSNGRYFDILTSYLRSFPKENIMIIFFEDIISKPEKVLQETFRFLGVDDSFVPPYLYEKMYASIPVRPRLIPALLHGLHLY